MCMAEVLIRFHQNTLWLHHNVLVECNQLTYQNIKIVFNKCISYRKHPEHRNLRHFSKSKQKKTMIFFDLFKLGVWNIKRKMFSFFFFYFLVKSCLYGIKLSLIDRSYRVKKCAVVKIHISNICSEKERKKKDILVNFLSGLDKSSKFIKVLQSFFLDFGVFFSLCTRQWQHTVQCMV